MSKTTTKTKIIVGAAIIGALILGWFIGGVSEYMSARKFEKDVNAANERIATLTVEKETAESNYAVAQGRAIELQNQLDTVSVSAGQSEVRLTAARKTTTEAKKHYEAKIKTTTVNDNRDVAIKRAELCARWAERGIIVTER